MSKESLKADVTPAVECLAQYVKLLSAVVLTTKLTVERETDGTNAGSMTAITELLEHEFTTGKIRTLVNGMHKVLFADAKANMAAKRKAEDAALLARAPKTAPKGRKVEELPEGSDEITDPSGVLGKIA